MRGARVVRLWAAFLLVHVWLTWLGVIVVPGAAFHDVDLYRWWAHLALEQGRWPGVDEPWVYPAGALVPILVPALVTTVSTSGYALAWCALVTAVDAAALGLVLRRVPGAVAAGWWWTGFLVLLGPVAIGRLDAVVAPVMLVALVLAGTRPALASALLTVGAWIKVAPGALLLPLVTAARHPWRHVVLPAAAVCAVVVAAVAAGGGLRHLTGFLGTQSGRGLQVESSTATGWVLASLRRDDVAIELDPELVTYQVHGPGTSAAADLLDLALPLVVLALAALLVRARRHGRATEALVPGSLALVAALVVTNKVGSPQLLAWFVAPVVLLVAARGVRRTGTPVLLLVAAAATQVVFPWGYMGLLTGDVAVTLVLALRNLLLVAVLVVAVVDLVRVGGPARAGGPEGQAVSSDPPDGPADRPGPAPVS